MDIKLYLEHHENGQLKIKSYWKPRWGYLLYSHGSKEGDYEEYFDNGQLKIKTNYSDNKKHGDYIEFHKNGQLKFKTTYFGGYKDGVYEEFHDNGQLKIKTTYENGKWDPVGSYEEFYENSQLKIRTFNNKYSCEEGDYQEYYENGQLKIKTIRIRVDEVSGVDGLRKISYYDYSGPYVEYYENGQLKIKTIDFSLQHPDSNKLYSPYEEYYENGDIKIKTIQLNKCLNQIEEYYKNEKLKVRFLRGCVTKVEYGSREQSQWSSWMKLGLYEEYYESGQLKLRKSYDDNGFLNGEYSEYYENGQLKILKIYPDIIVGKHPPYKIPEFFIGKISRNKQKIEIISFKELSDGYYEDEIFTRDIPKLIYFGKDKDGVYREYYENGQLKIDTFFYFLKNETGSHITEDCYYECFQGEYLEYYENGQLKKGN